MKEFNDLLTQLTRIGDALERMAASNEQIAAAQGVPAAHIEKLPNPPADEPAKGKPGRKPKEKAPEEQKTPEAPAPVEVPAVESMFEDEPETVTSYTADDVKHVLQLAMKAMPEAEVARIFRECNGGAAKISLMKPEFYAPVIDKFQALLEALPE